MKVREGFVSNSSSSSFVCDISGEAIEGYDGEYGCLTCSCVECNTKFLGNYLHEPTQEQLDMFSKEMLIELVKDNWRIDESIAYFFDDGKNANDLSDSEVRKYVNERLIDCIKENENGTISVPPMFCPTCNLTHISDKILVDYLLKRVGCIDREDCLREIRETHKTGRHFQACLKAIKGK